MPESMLRSYAILEKQLKGIREGTLEVEGAVTQGTSDYGTGSSRCNKNESSSKLGWDLLEKW